MNDMLNIEFLNDSLKKLDKAWGETLTAMEQSWVGVLPLMATRRPQINGR